MIKRSKQKRGSPLRKAVYFSIVSSIKSSGKLPDLDMSKQSRQRYVNKLVSDGEIRKIGYGTWEYLGNQKGQKEVNDFIKSPLKDSTQGTMFTSFQIRGHGFQFWVKIPKLKNWERREEYLKKKDYHYDLVGIKHNTPSINFRGYKIWLCTNSLIIYFPEGQSYFSDSAQGAKKGAALDLIKLLRALESFLNVSIRIGREYCFKFTKHHFANIKNEIAQDYNKQEKKLNVRYNGDLWLVIDNSYHLEELEAVHSTTAHTDMDNILMPFFNDLKAHHSMTGESLTMRGLLDSISRVVDNQAYHEANIKSHIGVLNAVEAAHHRLVEVVERLEKRLGDR